MSSLQFLSDSSACSSRSARSGVLLLPRDANFKTISEAAAPTIVFDIVLLSVQMVALQATAG